MAGSQEPDLDHPKNVPLSAVTRRQEPRIRALNASLGTWPTPHVFARSNNSRSHSQLSVSNSTLRHFHTLVHTHFRTRINQLQPPSRPIPQLRHLAAANLICWAAPLVVYIPLGPLHLSYSLTSPFSVHPFSSFLFFSSSQSSKQYRQDVWPSSRLHRLCRENPRWFFLGVRNCCCSLARTILVLTSQSSSLSGLTATQLGSTAIKGLSTPSFMPATCIRL